MSPNRPSKDKRAAQNRNRRAAREARKANAHAAAAAERPSSGTSSAGGGGLLSRLRGGSGARAPRAERTTPGPRPTGAATSAAALQPPGYRAALAAVLAAGAALVLCVVGLRYPVDRHGDIYRPETLVADWAGAALVAADGLPEGATAEEVADAVDDWTPGRKQETAAVALWPLSLALVLPFIGAAVGFRAVRRRAPSKIVNRALYATLFGAILTQGLLLLFLPVVLAMGVAMFQSRRAEVAAANAAQAAQAAEDDGAVAATAEDVIDVDEVEPDPQPDAEPDGTPDAEREP